MQRIKLFNIDKNLLESEDNCKMNLGQTSVLFKY